VDALEVKIRRRLSFLTQTTLSLLRHAKKLCGAPCGERFPTIAGPASDDICRRKIRQEAVEQLRAKSI